MKIALIGASGTVGGKVAEALQKDHDVIRLGSQSGDIRMDMTDTASIEAAFVQTGQIDAVVSTAGKVAFNSLQDMTEEEWALSLGNKLMGQINLTRIASRHLSDGGSITLSTGIIADHPISMGIAATTVNNALHGFVRAAALEMPRGQRINAVSATVLRESLGAYGPFFPGFPAIAGADAAQGFVRAVLGVETGQVFRLYEGL